MITRHMPHPDRHPVLATEPHPVLQPDPHAVLGTEPHPVLQPDRHPVLATEPHPVLQPDRHPVLATEPHPVLQPDRHPVLATEPHPVLQPDRHPVLATELHPDLQPDPHPVLATEPHPVLQPDPHPVLATEPHPVLQPDPHPVLGTEPHPVLQPDPHPVLGTEPHIVAHALVRAASRLISTLGAPRNDAARRSACATALLLSLTLSAQPQPTMHLTLADAQRIAVQNNPQYSAAKLNAAAAHQQPAEYRAAELPTMSGQLTGVGADNGSRLAAGALNNPTVYSRTAGGVTASQLITDFGRTHNLVGMSNLQAQAQDQNGEATRASVVLAATQAYFDVLRALAVLKVAGQTVTARQLVADQTTALANAQQRSTLDVTFANVNLSDAKLLQLQAENGVNSAEAELATALGIPEPDRIRSGRRAHARPAAGPARSADRTGHADPSRFEDAATAAIRRRAFHPR